MISAKQWRAGDFHHSWRWAPTCGAVIALLAALFTGGCGLGPSANGGENLLIITVDTLRADRLGAYGYAGAETPAMDRLASEGVRFSHAVTAAPTTLPSHATIFTGMTPPRHGVRDNAAGVLPAAALTLAEQFQASGFNTGAFVSAFVLDSRWGLSQGFDVYDGTPVAPGEAPASPQESERIGEQTVRAALDWIDSQRGENWFAWIHLFDPHAPYVAPEPFRSRYAADPYDGEVAYTDSLIARIRARLESSGMWAGTTVILTADHGEALHEHGEPAHGFFLYEPTLRVPLIVRLADNATDEGSAAAAGRGAVVDTAVGIIDIFSTVAELWGFDASDQAEGRSLAPALRGASIDTVPIYSETMLPKLYFGWHGLRAVTSGDQKFIEAPREELYDLLADPGEEINLAAVQPARSGELQDQLVAMVERSEAGAIGGDATTDPDRVAALRSLGYLGVGGASDDDDLADPKDKIEVYAAMMMALGEWQAGKTDEALRIIDEQIDTDPAFAGALHFRGIVLAGSGRYEEAAAAFEQALDVDAEHELAARELARAYRATGDVDRSAEVFGGLVGRQPLDVDLRWELADTLLRAARWDEARALLNEGLVLDAEAAKMHFGVGLVELLQAGDANAALVAFDSARKQSPYLPNLNYQTGVALERLGRLDDALAAYTDEATRQPRHYPAQFSRARLLAAGGAPLEEVIATLRLALAANAVAADAQLFLAQSLADRGSPADLSEAASLAMAGLSRVTVPALQAMGHLTLAQILDAQGKPEEAEQHRATAQRLASSR